MKVNPITRPLPGEHIVGVHPTMRPDVGPVWNRRLNYFTGRTLSDVALAAEQTERGGRPATLGQMVSSGVVSGLEVVSESQVQINPETGQPVTNPQTGRFARDFFYRVAPGLGFAASGESVFVAVSTRIPVMSLPVYAPVTLLDEADRILDGGQPNGLPQPDNEGILAPRRVGRALRDVIKSNVNLPQVGILVMQPVLVEIIGELNPDDPCEQDPQNFAFEDWQFADGGRLLYYAWPTELLGLPVADLRWRNRLAYAVFDAEMHSDSYPKLPWAEVGVPIGLAAFDSNWELQFVDRHSVVRDGGRPRSRTSLVKKAGDQFLWQARLQQFAEHMTDADFVHTPPVDLARQFRFLPPAGLLPMGAVELLTNATVTRVGRSNFFPAGFAIEAAPVPVEELDAVMVMSAPLQPFDFEAGEEVRVLVPVPEIWFEPNLLVVEQVAPDFQIAINNFTNEVNDWLQRRLDVRNKARVLGKATNARDPVFTDPDPQTATAVEPPEDAFGTSLAGGALVVTSFEDLKTDLAAAVHPTPVEAAQLPVLGLEGFIDFLKKRADRADDVVDVGFVRVQTDIFRVRQLILGNVAATRLATSPALAAIAQGESAVATKEDIQKYIASIRTAVGAPPAPVGAAGGPSGAPAAPNAAPSSIEGLARGVSMAPAGGPQKLRAINDGGLDIFDDLSQINLGVGGVGSVGTKTVGETLTTQTTGQIRGVFTNRATTRRDITDAVAVVGEVLDFRTLTIANRLQNSPATEARSFAMSTKFEVLSSLIKLQIDIDDVEVPGIFQLQNNERTRVVRTFGAIKATLSQTILGETAPTNGDEAAFFSEAVLISDSTIAVLRGVEGRIKEYKSAIDACQQVLNDVRAFAAKAAGRINEIEDELAEARHDLAVAQALLAEETRRVADINAKRDLIIANNVKFLAFQRERRAELNVGVPVRAIDPGLTQEPVPACLERHDAVPPELRSLVTLLREAPVKWFPTVQLLMDKLDRIELLHQTIFTAKERAQVRATDLQATIRATNGRFAEAIDKVTTAQHAIVSQYRLKAAQLDLSVFAGQNWQLTKTQATEVVSLGDLVDGTHARSDVSRSAAREIDQVSTVATCLYAKFGEVLPVIRLQWAEQLSQYDDAVNLRNLAVLPRWGEVEGLDRQEMQRFVDWLYQRVDPLQADAVAMISDLVRVCLLLASHAPVNQIIAGQIHRATTVT
ncbi:MAG TPA: hypothetical protein VFV34_07910, partial [Blastocatellia bacterium]|nr:hypothetical protein [Blastocatellia bacterium]